MFLCRGSTALWTGPDFLVSNLFTLQTLSIPSCQMASPTPDSQEMSVVPPIHCSKKKKNPLPFQILRIHPFHRKMLTFLKGKIALSQELHLTLSAGFKTSVKKWKQRPQVIYILVFKQHLQKSHLWNQAQLIRSPYLKGHPSLAFCNRMSF